MLQDQPLIHAFIKMPLEPFAPNTLAGQALSWHQLPQQDDTPSQTGKHEIQLTPWALHYQSCYVFLEEVCGVAGHVVLAEGPHWYHKWIIQCNNLLWILGSWHSYGVLWSILSILCFSAAFIQLLYSSPVRMTAHIPTPSGRKDMCLAFILSLWLPHMLIPLSCPAERED